VGEYSPGTKVAMVPPAGIPYQYLQKKKIDEEETSSILGKGTGEVHKPRSLERGVWQKGKSEKADGRAHFGKKTVKI